MAHQQLLQDAWCSSPSYLISCPIAILPRVLTLLGPRERRNMEINFFPQGLRGAPERMVMIMLFTSS